MSDQRKPTLYDAYRSMYNQGKLFWDKNGGKICTIAGTTGLFLSGAHACRTTYKRHDELKETGKRIAAAKRDKRYFDVVKEVAKSSKHYLPDLVAGVLSGYVSNKGYTLEHNNYQKTATMLGVVTADFLNYRKNVISEHGKDADRRYLNTKKEHLKVLEENDKSNGDKTENDQGIVVSLNEDSLRILYSRETTPQVWSEAHYLRINHLERIRNELDWILMHGGSYSVNDVRRQFYGRRGDVPEGGMFGRIWDPGNPEHPERGRRVNLHYEDDEMFMSGLTDHCWIEIEIDDEPLFESMAAKNQRDMDNGIFPRVEQW